MHIGGKVIATTPEHPFAEYSKKWTPAGALEQDDLLLGMEQERTAVEEVFDTGEYVTVYNVLAGFIRGPKTGVGRAQAGDGVSRIVAQKKGKNLKKGQ